MPSHNTHAQRGFTLVELLVVLVVILLATVAAATIGSNILKQNARERFATSMAQQLHQLHGAVSRYIAEHRGDFAVSVRQEIGIATLMTEQFLPPNWAATNGVPGVSPYGTRYRAYAIKSPDDERIVRAVMTDEGPIARGPAVRAGFALDATDRSYTEHTIALTAALQAQQNHRLVSGIVNRDTRLAIGVDNAFNFDLTPWLPSALDRERPVVFAGFPELDGGASNTDQAITESCPFWRLHAGNRTGGNDGVFHPSRYFRPSLTTWSDWQDGGCPAGWMPIATVPACPQGEAEGLTVPEISSSLSYFLIAQEIGAVNAGTCDENRAPDCAGKFNTTIQGFLNLNRSHIHTEDRCGERVWRAVWNGNRWVAGQHINEVRETAHHVLCCNPNGSP